MMILPGRDLSWKEFLKDVWREFNHDNLDDTAGMLAFSAVFALFPFLLFVVSLAGMMIDRAQTESLIGAIRQLVPKDVASILSDRMHALATGKNPALLTVSGVGAVWAASSGIAATMRALNTVYGVRESRSFLRVRAIAVGITLLGAVLGITAAIITVALPAILHHLGFFGEALLWLRFPAAAILVMLIIACLYYFLPDVEQSFKFLTPGSVFAVLVWLLASWGFSEYVSHLGSYEVSYGALGGIVVLLMWMYISSVVVLLGAEINAILEHRSPEGKRVGARSLDDKGPDLRKARAAAHEAKADAVTKEGAEIPTRNVASPQDIAKATAVAAEAADAAPKK
jgi:membrane protein